MIYQFTIRQHDTAPSLLYIATERNGAPVDLSEYQTATFTLKRREALASASPRTAEIVDPENGILRFEWQAADTATAGVYFGEFELQGSSTKRTFPIDHPIRIDVLGDLDGA